MRKIERRTVSKKGEALFDATPTAALLNMGFRDRDVGLYSILRMESSTGAQVVNWYEGEVIGLPRYTGHVKIRELAKLNKRSRASVSRALRKMHSLGLISIERSSRKFGVIYRVFELESIPSVSKVVRMVKANTRDESSLCNYLEKILDQKHEWANMSQSLSQLIASKHVELKEFFDFIRGASETMREPLRIPTDLSTDFATQGVKGPPVGDLVFSDAVASRAANAAEGKNAALVAPLISGEETRSLTRSTSDLSATSEVSKTAIASVSTGTASGGKVEFSQRVIDRLFDLGFSAKFKAKQTVADISLAIEESEKEVLNWSGFDFIRDSARLDSFFLSALGLIMYKKSST